MGDPVLVDVTLTARQRIELRDLFVRLSFPPSLQKLAAGVIQAANARPVEIGRATAPEAIPFEPDELAFLGRVLDAQLAKLQALRDAIPANEPDPEPAV